MKLNLNTILLVLAGLGVFAPDVASVAAWLASMNIAWLGTVVKGLGLLAAFCSAAPLVVPRLRSFLALLGLATPPGAQAPWNPGRDGNPPAVTPLVSVPGSVTPPAGTRPGAGYPGKGGALLIFLGAALLTASSCAWWQKHGPQIDCAALATVVDAPQLVAIVEGCMVIVVTPAAIPACVSAAAAESKWASDVLGCFERATQGKASCPAFKAGQIKLKAMRASAGASK